MKVDVVFVRGNSKFSSLISKWAINKSSEVKVITDKFQDHFQQIDGLLIFNENQKLIKEIQEISTYFDKQQKVIHKIDINGTLMVAISNLELWFESTKVKKVYVVGSDELILNPNLDRFLQSII